MTETTPETGPITFERDGVKFALRAQSVDAWPWQYGDATLADIVASINQNPELKTGALAGVPFPQPPPGESLHKATLELLAWANAHTGSDRVAGNVTAFRRTWAG